MNLLTSKQREFIKNATHRYNFKVGARRCGKTYLDMLYTIPKRIEERKNKDGLNVILGVSKGTIERNVLEPMRKIYGVNRISKINSQNIAILFGEEVYCLGAEKVSQVSKIQGTSIKYLYGDEIAKWNKDVFIMVQGSLDKSYSCFDGALNPENKNHWLKLDFLDKIEEKKLDVYVQYYTIFDNEYLSKEFVQNLCKEYQGTVFYNRLILGQWCDAEGLIFTPIANDKNRYLTMESITGSIFIGIDWGGNKSKHSITACRIPNDYSKVQVLASDTMKATGTDTKEVFRWINNFIKKIVDKYKVIPKACYCDSAEQLINNTLRSNIVYKIPILDSIKMAINERIKAIISLLNLDRLSFIEKETDTIIEALQTALYDDKAKDDRWIDDGETSDIDSLDSFWYAIEYFIEAIMNFKGVIASG